LDEIHGGALSAWLSGRRLEMGRPYLRGRVLDVGCHVGRLAEMCQPEAYLGVDINERALDLARATHPGFRFAASIPEQERFDTVAAFAFIEHVSNPGVWLVQLASLLKPGGRIVLTTPHPSLEWAHTVGANLHLFSHDAHQEHEELLDRKRLEGLAASAGLRVEAYKRFMFGANQLVVLCRGAQVSDAA
jgi:2-polyprenyl-3-methyl-5-hydroxy-6-metoxy-1,4-benzoquinol methylase